MNDITSYITKSYSISGNNFVSRKPLVIYIKNHLFANFNTLEKFSYPLHLALPVFTLSHSPEIRRIKKHAEKWSEATSINQKKHSIALR